MDLHKEEMGPAASLFLENVTLQHQIIEDTKGDQYLPVVHRASLLIPTIWR